MIYKKLIPSSLLGRSLIIVFFPILTLVVLTTFVFYQTSWNIISKRLTQSVVADINVITKLIDQNLENEAIKLAKEDFKMIVEYQKNTNLNPLFFKNQRGILAKRLHQALESLQMPFFYDLNNLNEGAIVTLQFKTDLLVITIDKDRLYSGSAFVFLLWMFFASFVLLMLSYFFMKGQIRPLKRLSIIAEITPIFLSDNEIRKIIELIFFSYREFTSGPDAILEKINFGRAHHRVIYFVGKKKQITIRDLLSILNITKQSLSRVLNQLVKEKYIMMSTGNDKRTKNLSLTKKGLELEKNLTKIQINKIKNIFKNSAEIDINGFKKILFSMIDRETQKKFKELNK